LNLKFWKKIISDENKPKTHLVYSLNSNKKDCEDLEKRLAAKGVKAVVTSDHIMNTFTFDCEAKK